MRRFEEFLDWSDELQIPAVTAWLLSRENLSRPAEELGPYFEVLEELFARLPEQAARCDMRIKVIGSLDLLPESLVSAAKRAQESAPTGSRRLNIAMGYGGRQEIVDAARDLVTDLVAEGVPTEELASRIDADALAAHMYSSDVPDPDLLIRTSGESRLSGFLLWQSAYAELIFLDRLWPDFAKDDLESAIREFQSRDRRYGAAR